MYVCMYGGLLKLNKFIFDFKACVSLFLPLNSDPHNVRSSIRYSHYLNKSQNQDIVNGNSNKI